MPLRTPSHDPFGLRKVFPAVLHDASLMGCRACIGDNTCPPGGQLFFLSLFFPPLPRAPASSPRAAPSDFRVTSLTAVLIASPFLQRVAAWRSLFFSTSARTPFASFLFNRFLTRIMRNREVPQPHSVPFPSLFLHLCPTMRPLPPIALPSRARTTPSAELGSGAIFSSVSLVPPPPLQASFVLLTRECYAFLRSPPAFTCRFFFYAAHARLV